MSQELAAYQTSSPAPITEQKLASYLDAMGLAAKLTPQEKTQFIEIAQAFGLNPFIREIYATKYGTGDFAKFSIIVGYEVYLKRAERSGQLSGWAATTAGSIDNGDLRGIVTIHRRDWNQPLVHEVYYSEYVQTTFDKETKQQRPNKMWSEKPFTMIKKVAIAQGFRMAFPVELGGIPYTSDEMPTIQEQAAIVTTEQATMAVANALPRRTKLEQAQDSQKLLEWQNAIDHLPAEPGLWTAHAEKLGTLEGIARAEKVILFKSLCNLAFEQGLDYDKESKSFWFAEPELPVAVAAPPILID